MVRDRFPARARRVGPGAQKGETMNAVELYRHLLRNAHEFLEGTMTDVTPGQFTWDPPGTAFSIAGNYAHVVASEDFGIHALLQGGEMLAATTWSGRIGASDLPPLGPGGDTKEWSRRAKLDLAAMRRYAHAVYAATDEYLARLKPDDLTRPIDLSRFGFGQRDALFVLGALLANASLHTGEISCLKGAQGAKGYPV
jgi:hypothetical protein